MAVVNLYRILRITADADADAITAALQRLQAEGKANDKIVWAVHEWLLKPQVRQRYDAKLRQEQPDFFPVPMTHTTVSTAPDSRLLAQTLPVLWPPQHLLPVSLLLNVGLGVLLLAWNWQRLGQQRQMRLNVACAAAYVLLLWLMLVGGMGLAASLAINTAAVLLWYVGCVRRQQAFLAEHDCEYLHPQWQWWCAVVLATVLAVLLLSFAAALYVLP